MVLKTGHQGIESARVAVVNAQLIVSGVGWLVVGTGGNRNKHEQKEKSFHNEFFQVRDQGFIGQIKLRS